MIKISYLIQILDPKNSLILPSNLALNYNLRIICSLNINKINLLFSFIQFLITKNLSLILLH